MGFFWLVWFGFGVSFLGFFFLFKNLLWYSQIRWWWGMDKINLKCRKSFNKWVVPIWIYNTFKGLENVIFDSKNILQRDTYFMNKSMYERVCVGVCLCVCISVLCWGCCTYTHTKKAELLWNQGKSKWNHFRFSSQILSDKNPSRFWPLSQAPVTTTLKPGLLLLPPKLVSERTQGHVPAVPGAAPRQPHVSRRSRKRGLSESCLWRPQLLLPATGCLRSLVLTPLPQNDQSFSLSAAIHCLRADRGQKAPAIRVHLWAMLQPQFLQLWNGKNKPQPKWVLHAWRTVNQVRNIDDK